MTLRERYEQGALRQITLSTLVWLMLSLVISTLSCSKSATTPIVTELSSTNQAINGFTYQLFQINSSGQESGYVGTLQWGKTGIEWPSSLSAYLQQMASKTMQVQYFVKVYSTSAPGENGDVYYEAPVTGNSIVFNGPSTALWYAMRSSAAAANAPIMFSPPAWQNLLFFMNSSCPDCLIESGSTAFQILQNSSGLQSSISQYLVSIGSPALSASVLKSAPIGVAYSSPALLDSTVTLSENQGQSQSFQVSFFDPLNLSSLLAPDSWSILLPSSPTPESISPAPSASQATWIFDSSNTGLETVSAAKAVRGISYLATFNCQVAYMAFPPVLNIPTLNFQANHDQIVDLSSYGTDPRNESLTYTLLSGPTGMSIITTSQADCVSGACVEWNPTQQPVSQVGATTAQIEVINSSGSTTTQTVTLLVQSDNYPQFYSIAPSSWSLSEGTTGTLSFDVSDIDGDPIEVSCVSGCTSLLSQFPTGAGWPVLTYPNSSIYADGGSGTESVSIAYMPSYLQEIGSNGTWPIVLSLNYPLSNTTLRQVYAPTQQTVTLSILNVADPPVWSVQPVPSPSASPTEVSPMSPMAGGDATVPAVNPASDNLIIYSISNVTGIPGGASYCSWLTLTPATAVASGTAVTISGTPPYTSSATCLFTLRATDLLGLITDSSQVIVNVVNVPRPISANGTVPAQTATEGTIFTLNMSSYFSDPDVGDPKEVLTYTCLNCAALGIPTSGNNGESFTSSIFNWTPIWGTAPTGSSQTFTGIQIQATNTGGYTATQTFNLTVNPVTSPMLVSFSSGTLPVTGTPPSFATALNANTSGTVLVQVGNYPGDSSAYNYTLSAACAPSCSATVDTLSAPTGTAPGTTNFTLTLTPSYSDGYGGHNSTSNPLTITLTATDSTNPLISASGAITVNVGTEDRPLTALVINGDSGTGTYSSSIDGSSYNPNNYTLNALGPDASNDTFTFSLQGSAFGTISGSSWGFNPVALGCQPGTSSTTENFTLLATSSHGQTITRAVSMSIINALLGGGGGCPY